MSQEIVVVKLLMEEEYQEKEGERWTLLSFI